MSLVPVTSEEERTWVCALVTGRVQGVGFRPFVCRLATEVGIAGQVQNRAGGVRIHAAGPEERVARFFARLRDEAPAGARIVAIEDLPPEPIDARGFVIAPSDPGGPSGPLPLDTAPCANCVTELFRPGDRRHRYPFVSCATCGPRYSVIEALPYDRVRTSMWPFALCAECDVEYHDPWNRRFHAESISCPACGPRLALLDRSGRLRAREGDALARTTAAIAAGAIVAVKGVGGFQLVVAARNARAVTRLRERKGRPDKPFALMVRSLETARRLCRLDALAASTLAAPSAPIVLLPRRPDADVAAGVAPSNLDLGLMLPASPLHHLLAAELDAPVVVTSANRSGDPICFRDDEVLPLLSEMADLVLTHDREIVHPIDDSVVRVVHRAPRVLRAARGCAPISLSIDEARPGVVGRGAYLKNTVAVSGWGTVRLSPHIGDLRSPASRRVATELEEWFRSLENGEEAHRTVVDLHPDEVGRASEVVHVQHHHAHVLSCMAENAAAGPVLGVAWDGNGYGPDGTIWGGEFLVCDRRAFHRVAHLRTFPLPGAERAIEEGRRAALGLLFEIGGVRSLSDLDVPPARSLQASERRTIVRMLERGLNCPRTSSMGRLFDAVASLADIRHRATFEGQAALALEQAARGAPRTAPYPFVLARPGPGRALVVDWEPLVRAVVDDVRAGRPVSTIAVRFHEALAELLVAVAREVGLAQVALSGGCFQNQVLLERAIDRLREAGFDPLVHRRVPPNDGGIALGQVAYMAAVAVGEG